MLLKLARRLEAALKLFCTTVNSSPGWPPPLTGNCAAVTSTGLSSRFMQHWTAAEEVLRYVGQRLQGHCSLILSNVRQAAYKLFSDEHISWAVSKQACGALHHAAGSLPSPIHKFLPLCLVVELCRHHVCDPLTYYCCWLMWISTAQIAVNARRLPCQECLHNMQTPEMTGVLQQEQHVQCSPRSADSSTVLTYICDSKVNMYGHQKITANNK